MKLKHIISASQFDKNTISAIFALASKIKNGNYDKKVLSGKILASLFYEPSTRTRLSFESAMLKLGGKIISTENAKEFSSAAKGETLEDSIRVINYYSDVIVLRHFMAGASEIAAKFSKVPVINAGDGNGEHPTQAMLDLYTIFSKFPKGDDFTVALIGDLLNGRTIHSLAHLLSLYKKVKIFFISPKDIGIPQDLRSHLRKTGIKFQETEEFENSLREADVIYQTRIQKERYKRKEDYQKYFGKYIIDKSILGKIKKSAIIMHPLPRINEITADVDQDPRAVYFAQAQNGLFIRMALLFSLLGPKTAL